jgi:hypothetical protein
MQPNTTNLTPQQPAPRPTYKILTIIFLITTLTLAGAVTYLLLRPVETTENSQISSDQDSANSGTESATAAENYLMTIKNVQNLVTSLKYSLQPTGPDGSILYSGYTSSSSGGTPLKLDGYSFEVMPSQSYDLTVDAVNSIKPTDHIVLGRAFSNVSSYMKSQSFSLDSYKFVDAASLQNYTIARNGSIICFINYNLNSANENNFPLYVSCADYSWYQSKAEQLLPFAEAYKTQDGSWPSSIFTVDYAVHIKDSPASPYQTTVLTGDNFAMLFYRTSPESTWQYFTGTQSPLSCDRYNTVDLKKAFQGEPCYINGRYSEVGR